MGMLIEGVWREDADRHIQNGAFEREPSTLANRPVPTLAEHLCAGGRIVLIVSLSCPWSHRTVLVRAVKGLSFASVLVAGGPRTEGYALPKDDPLGPMRHVHQIYAASDPNYTGRATVPLLWDCSLHTILSNESAHIARAFDHVPGDWKLVPPAQEADIDALNARIYDGLANAVYRAGFATRQDAYDQAMTDVFGTLDWLESRLTDNRCLFGTQITEADLFLFATLCRFDAVYAPLFRCTRQRLVDYPALWAYTRDLYAWPGIQDTLDFAANLAGYFQNDTDNNPHGIVPELPRLDWQEPHGRDRLGPLTVWQDGSLVSFDRVVEAQSNG